MKTFQITITEAELRILKQGLDARVSNPIHLGTSLSLMLGMLKPRPKNEFERAEHLLQTKTDIEKASAESDLAKKENEPILAKLIQAEQNPAEFSVPQQ